MLDARHVLRTLKAGTDNTKFHNHVRVDVDVDVRRVM